MNLSGPDNVLDHIDSQVGSSNKANQIHLDTDLPPLRIRDKEVLLIIQGWMGVGISNSNLAGEVARIGWVGTLSSVGLPYLAMYSPWFAQAMKEKKNTVGRKLLPEEVEEVFHAVNYRCIQEEIRRAKKLSEGNGLVAINVMRAVGHYEGQVLAACEAWVDMIVSGAGIPVDLPNITKDYPDVALAPIVSNLRTLKIVWKRWERFNRRPDLIVVEDPTRAAGHLGSPTLEKLWQDPDSLLENAIPQMREFLDANGGQDIPLAAAGWIVDRNDIDRMLQLGASAVQMGTRFLASEESGANEAVKQAVLDANSEEDILAYMSSALLPARGLKSSGVFSRIKDLKAFTRECAINCLIECGYRDGKPDAAQMCILDELLASTMPKKGADWLMFASQASLRIHTVQSVEQIMRELTRPQ